MEPWPQADVPTLLNIHHPIHDFVYSLAGSIRALVRGVYGARGALGSHMPFVYLGPSLLKLLNFERRHKRTARRYHGVMRFRSLDSVR